MKVFIGEFPPPFGGVAVKDGIIYKSIYKPMGVRMLDLVKCKRKPWVIPFIGVKLILYLIASEQVIIGVGTEKRLEILLLLRKMLRGRRGLSTTQIVVMGGSLHNSVIYNQRLKNLLITSKTLWVETIGMSKVLLQQGFNNIKVFPNCRTEKGATPPDYHGETIRLVFFSRICKEKGVDRIIKATERIKSKCSIDFYGEIEDGYRTTFLDYINSEPHVCYHGVFDSVNGDLYGELNKYDVMIFLSEWSHEGVPGVLVEAKMSGITTIVSDINFNSEIVIDGVEGIVTNDDLEDVLNNIDIGLIEKLKMGSFQSRKRYALNRYEQMMRNELLR